jgi:hypothetical protein
MAGLERASGFKIRFPSAGNCEYFFPLTWIAELGEIRVQEKCW